jgi:2-octaprenyl-6-methoxyphenol hydroxylase
MQKSQIAIVGAGIPGLSLALILANQNFNITVIERGTLPESDKVKPSARTTALMQGSLDILARAGVWPAFKPHCTPLRQLSIIDDSTFPKGADNMIREDFKAEELGLAEFGYNIPLIAMTAALGDLARSHKNITILENTTITQDDDAILNADLIVGADGRKSIIREWAGIKAQEKYYDQTAITCVISHTLPHNNTSTEFHRSGGPCTFVPYGENTSAVVWVEKTDDADAIFKLPKQNFIQALQDRTREILGQIDLIVPPESWPLMTLKTDRLIAPRIALIAEAAHVLSPIGAQGLNLSLRDVGALADIIIVAQLANRDVGCESVLKKYERDRRRDIAPRVIGIDLFNDMIANDNIFIRGARRLGLQAIRHAGPLRTILMRAGLAPKH